MPSKTDSAGYKTLTPAEAKVVAQFAYAFDADASRMYPAPGVESLAARLDVGQRQMRDFINARKATTRARWMRLLHLMRDRDPLMLGQLAAVAEAETARDIARAALRRYDEPHEGGPGVALSALPV